MYGLRNSELSTCLLVCFNSVIKRVKQCCCRLILLPKSTINANLTTTNRFFTNDDWQRGRFENFESDHRYESNLESDVRFEIESNHEASQVPTLHIPQLFHTGQCHHKNFMLSFVELPYTIDNHIITDITNFYKTAKCLFISLYTSISGQHIEHRA